jgi:vitamin B12 transporter
LARGDSIFPAIGHFVGGLRGTSSEASDSQVSPRVALEWSPVEAPYRAEVSWGTGFKDPSFFALANPLVGNPDLVPEKSESLRARWDMSSADGRGRLGLTLFHDQFEDLIDFFPGPPPQMRNIGGVTLRGIQLDAQWTATPQLRFFGHLSWQDWNLEDPGDELLLRPTWLGTAAAEYRPTDRVRASLVQRWVGEREDSSIATGDRQLPAFLTTDLLLDIGVSEQWSFRFILENLFDREEEVRVGLPAPGRRLKVQTGVVF